MASSEQNRVAPGGAPSDNARRTKIVATVGPASRDPEVLRQLFEAGVDVFRLNFAHGTPEEHAETVRRIRQTSEQVGREVGILGDLPGPKLRLGDLEGDVAVLHSGSTVWMRGETNGTPGNPELLTVQWDGFAKAVHEGDPVFLADGRVRLRVVSVADGDVTSRSRPAVPSAPPGRSTCPAPTPSYPRPGSSTSPGSPSPARTGSTCSPCRSSAELPTSRRSRRLRERGADIPLIAKIEKPQAAERAEEIIDAADSGIMVARGDLGVELPIEEVPARRSG